MVKCKSRWTYVFSPTTVEYLSIVTGAADVPGGRSVGLGISLPFEEDLNAYIPDELAFEFHYFFMRKLWFLYLAQCVVIFPGGFGTMDEFFETLTLRQTGKINRPLPMVLFGTQYWDEVFNPEAMARYGTISPEDVHLFHRSDTVDDALWQVSLVVMFYLVQCRGQQRCMGFPFKKRHFSFCYEFHNS